jgi:hypothetical protein
MTMRRMDVRTVVVVAILLALAIWGLQYILRSTEVVCDDGTGHECVTPTPR